MATTSFPEFLRFRAGLLSDARGLPGLLAPPSPPQPPQMAPQAPQQSGGLASVLGAIFGGADDPNLTPEQNQAARRQALIQAGLGILASEKRGLGAIGEGGLYGQQVGQQARQAIYGRTQQERIANALQDPAIMALVPDGVRRILPYLPPDQALEVITKAATAGPGEPKVVGDRLVSPTGKVLFEGGPKPPELSQAVKDELWRAGIGPNELAGLTPEQRDQIVAAADRRSKDLKGPGLAEILGGIMGINKIPTIAQSAVVSLQNVDGAFDQYEKYAKEWAALPTSEKVAGKVGVPDAKRDALLANVDASHNAVLLEIKNLAQLGVLSGPDVGIVTGIIGDPTAWQEIRRDPGAILERLKRAREYIDRAKTTYEKTYGIKVPGPAAEPNPYGPFAPSVPKKGGG